MEININRTFSLMNAGLALLRGAGQVMFQGNALTGFFFLLGIFWGAYESDTPAVAWGAVVGLLSSTLAGMMLREPANEGDEGLWGFNGILVGCAFPTFLANTPLMWLALIFSAMLTTWARRGFNHVMKPWKTNSFTFPFVFISWIFLFASRMLKGMPPEYLAFPELSAHLSSAVDLTPGSLMLYWLKGISQVFLINSWIAGLFFLVGLYLCNRWAAMWAAIGSAMALVLALLYGGAGSSITDGLYGFSPVLTAIALGCTFYQPCWRSRLWCLMGIVATFFIQAGMDALMLPFGVPTFTAPFCIATWLFLLPLYQFDEKVPDHSHWHKS